MDSPAQYITATNRSLRGDFIIRFGEMLPQPLMGTSSVVTTCIFQKYRFQMTFVDDEQVLETLLTNRTHPPFGKRIGIRGSNGSTDDFVLLCSKYLIEGGRKFRIVIVEEIANHWFSLFEFPAQLPGLLGHPSVGEMRGTTGELDASRTKVDEEEHVQRLQKQGLKGEEVTGDNLLFVMRHDLSPT